MRKIVIIGLGAAGYAALSAFKRLGCCEELTVIDPKSADLMHPCAIPYALEGAADPEKILQNISLNRIGVNKITGRAVHIDSKEKKIIIQTLSETIYADYDCLLLCTGSSPVIPLIKGIELSMGYGFFTLATAADLESVRNSLPGKKRGVVIGAGAIGLESAAALKKYLPAVTVIEMKDQILPGVLDPDMAGIVKDKLEKEGIEFRCGVCTEEILFDKSLTGLVAGGETINADIGICAAGFKSHTELFDGTGADISSHGVRTDMAMRTSVEEIFAAGDCVETLSVIDHKPIGTKLATSAYRQGTIAAYTMAGKMKEYKGSAGTFVTKIFGIEIAGTGFTTEAAKERGYDPVIAKITSHILPDYYYRNEVITVKIVADRATGLVLGAQAVGHGAAARINVVSTALEAGMDLCHFEQVELAYCPAVSEVCDPLMRAVEGAMRRVKK